MTGIILAGGENRRMGSEKSFLVVAGKPLIEHIIAVHRKLFDTTIVVTRSPERYRGYPVVVVEDAMDLRGPLTGIYSGMLRSSDECHFVSACDMPFMNPRLIEYLAAQIEGYDAVVPRLNGMAEPLHAVYHRRLLPLIENCLKARRQKVQSLFERAKVRYVADDEIGSIDPEKRSFKNVNTPQEYKEALCSDLACRN